MNIELIRKIINCRQIEWQRHAFIKRIDVKSVILTG